VLTEQKPCDGTPLRNWDNCQASPQCCPERTTCYEKNQSYSGCLPTGTCSTTKLDPWDQLLWTCQESSTSVSGQKLKVDHWGIGGKLSVVGTNILNQNGFPFQMTGLSGYLGCGSFLDFVEMAKFWDTSLFKLMIRASDDLHKIVEVIEWTKILRIYLVLDTRNPPPNFWQFMAAQAFWHHHVIYQVENSQDAVQMIRSNICKDCLIIRNVNLQSEIEDPPGPNVVYGVSADVACVGGLCSTSKETKQTLVELQGRFPLIISSLGVVPESNLASPVEVQPDSFLTLISGKTNKTKQVLSWIVSAETEQCAPLNSWKPLKDYSASRWLDASYKCSRLLGQGERCLEAFPEEESCCMQGLYCHMPFGEFGTCLLQPAEGASANPPELCTEKQITPARILPTYNYSQAHGKLRLDGVQLVDEHGSPIQLRGVSTHGIHWFQECYNRQAIQALVYEWSVTVVRIAFYIDEGGYKVLKGTPQDPLPLLHDIVRWTEEFGIYVIIDWHVHHPGDPNVYLEDGLASEFWTHIAQRYKDKRHVLYEIANEPNGDDLTWDRLLEYHNTIIGVIRGVDPETVIIAGVLEYSTDLYKPVVKPVAQPYNVMYTFHMYTSCRNNQGEKTDIAACVQTRRRFSIMMENIRKVPVFVTEWAPVTVQGTGIPDLTTAKAWLGFLNSHNISHIVWSFADKAEGAALLAPTSCRNSNFGNATCSGEYLKHDFRKSIEPEGYLHNITVHLSDAGHYWSLVLSLLTI